MKTIKIKRKISSSLLRIKELEKFKGKRVEIKLDINEINESDIAENENLAGVFSQYADSKLSKKENQAWSLAVNEKYEN
ncbi:MAG: hypothetical protein PHW27_13070 [Melioribacteraceae bacterium]|nr:hypothetical protein [Melioribacteraceae bacterium]MDD3559490.1 hypothetical protein [Melioribacteraceae bacterium]